MFFHVFGKKRQSSLFGSFQYFLNFGFHPAVLRFHKHKQYCLDFGLLNKRVAFSKMLWPTLFQQF